MLCTTLWWMSTQTTQLLPALALSWYVVRSRVHIIIDSSASAQGMSRFCSYYLHPPSADILLEKFNSCLSPIETWTKYHMWTLNMKIPDLIWWSHCELNRNMWFVSWLHLIDFGPSEVRCECALNLRDRCGDSIIFGTPSLLRTCFGFPYCPFLGHISYNVHFPFILFSYYHWQNCLSHT